MDREIRLNERVAMNRRRFCLSFAASVASAATAKGIPQCAHALPSKSLENSSSPYVLWSQLIPVLQCKCAHDRGYMIAENTAVPDSLPALPTAGIMTPIQRAMEAARHPEASYTTEVPTEWQPQFAEAVDEAKRRHDETATLERRLILPKRYRLLSKDEISAYYALSPHVARAGWRPDPKAVREYKGWNDLSCVSVPYYDISRKLAMIWASTGGAGCSTSGWHFFTRSEPQAGSGAEVGWALQKWNTMQREECA